MKGEEFFPYLSLRFTSLWVPICKLISPYTILCKIKVVFPLASIMFHVHTDHFLEGVKLTGGIPLILQVDHLGVIGITGSLLVMEGFISPVELTGMCPCSVSVALLVKVAGTRLSIGKLISLMLGDLS